MSQSYDDRMDENLALWGRAEVLGPLGGGNRNAVLGIRIAQRRLAARRSGRGQARTGRSRCWATSPATGCASRWQYQPWTGAVTSMA